MPALAAAVGLLASLVLVAWLRSHRYRYADEVDLPHRRHVWVLLTLPLAAAAVAYQLKDLPQLVAVLYGLTLIPLTALTAIDLDVQRLPDLITLPMLAGSVATAAVCSAVADRPGSFQRALLGGAAMLAVFGVLWLAGRGMGLGFGDVKLAPPLGVLTAWFSWTTFAVSVYATVLTAAAYGIGLLVLGRGQRGTTFAYGPFMIFGTVAAVLVAS